MESANKRSIHVKIIASFSIVSGLLVVLSVIVLWSIAGIEEDVTMLVKNTIPRLSYIGSLREKVAFLQISTLRHILAKEIHNKTHLEQQVGVTRDQVDELLRYKESLVFSEQGQKLYNAVLDCHKNYEILQDDIIVSSRAGLTAKAQALNTDMLRPQYDDYQNRLEKLEQHIIAGAQEREQTVLNSIFIIKKFCFFLTITSLIISAWMIIIVIRVIKALREQNNLLQVEIKGRQRTENENKNLIISLEQTLEKVKQLKGLLPICCACKKIRDDAGYWNSIETFIAEHSTAEFTHGICPDCAEKLYPGIYKKPV
jgi:hypothetical protein